MTDEAANAKLLGVETHGGWKVAKGDYRIFVGLFPAGPLADEVQQLRAQHDPVTAAITGVHVTLAGLYWRTGEPIAVTEAETAAALRTALEPLAPIDLVLQGVDTFRNDVAFLSVVDNDAMMAARAACLGVLGEDKPNFHPHCTIAMRLSKTETRACADALRATKWHTEAHTFHLPQLQLMQRSPAEPTWRCIAELPLRGGASE